MLAVWELFREELLRNISPNENKIRETFQFLVENNLCDSDTFEKLVQVRLMASYEAGINKYLHPPVELKQGNIKAESLHLGTIVEELLKILIQTIEERQKISISENKKNTFHQVIETVKNITDIDKSLMAKIDELRKERNKIHLRAIGITEHQELNHEEYKVLEYRQKLIFFISELKRILDIN